MGCYVNPKDMTKEQWLHLNGDKYDYPDWETDDTRWVCLVDNGPFTAAGVCFDEVELRNFNRTDDNRYKEWYLVEIDKLREVSDIDRYIR
jgi:hypothetical protein